VIVPLLYYVNVSLHVLSAITWVGGMLFLGAVGAPVLRAIEPPSLRQEIFRSLGVRFRGIGWAAIALLVATGVFNLSYRGWLHWDGVLGSAAFWRTVTGHALAVKLVMVTVMIVVSAAHDFWLGPAAVQVEPGTSAAMRLRRRAALIARVNALLGVIVVIAAVVLTRGG
jgi:uncharacterized membrane protein